ncbi:2OG-Fe(II) oxygenase [Streptomyces sp. Je 1-332]|uniref:2OG-Fe(II) oxygenase n=1 Tax=Streptomyces sp. Je 1-332 TaxID=3231270 RepID=UPI00345A514E
MSQTGVHHASPYLPVLRAPAELASLRRLLTGKPARPVHLDGFLPAGQAARLAGALRAMPRWTRSPVLWDDALLETTPVALEEFRDAPSRRRAAVRQVAQDIPKLFDDGSTFPAGHRAALSDFFVFAGMGPVLVDLLAQWIAPGAPITTNVEFARYGTDDYLGEHSDTGSDTLFVLNLYLDEAYKQSDGGVLGFRNEEGEEFLMPARYNSLSVMPIRRGCVHWVSPWRRDSVGRHTVSIAATPTADRDETAEKAVRHA